jgi:hypothetical protein
MNATFTFVCLTNFLRNDGFEYFSLPQAVMNFARVSVGSQFAFMEWHLSNK